MSDSFKRAYYPTREEKWIQIESYDLGKWQEAVVNAWNDGYRKGRQDGALFGELKGEE